MLRRKLQTLGLMLVAIVGLSLLLYPTVSDLWNERHATRLITDYVARVDTVAEKDYTALWEAAENFNAKLKAFKGYELSPELEAEYYAVLDPFGLGIMSYVEIPSIDVTLPIYHGTSDAVLQVAAGHIEWTSLPIGGEGNHSVISGHRGLTTAKLFTNLPQLEPGDLFYIRTLNEMMTYEVDQIITVLPYEVDELLPVEGKDYFTLVTCTPLGINTHRLLVRGHRIENVEEAARVFVPADGIRIEPLAVAPFLAAPIVFLLIVIVFLTPEKPSVGAKKRFPYE